MKSLRRLSLALALVAAGAAHAAPVLSDNFQSGLSSAVWTTNASGVVVTDPLNSGNSVLAFTTTRGGGDIWSLPVGVAGNYTVSFDVLGTCSSGNCGAFLGIQDSTGEHWLFGDQTYGTPHPTRTTGAWQHISFSFTATSAFRVKMEDYNGAPRDIYFDNLCVASDGSCSATATRLPEPGALALVGVALAGLGIARRRRG